MLRGPQWLDFTAVGVALDRINRRFPARDVEVCFSLKRAVAGLRGAAAGHRSALHRARRLAQVQRSQQHAGLRPVSDVQFFKNSRDMRFHRALLD